MRFLLIRHGESEANVQNVFSNTGYKHGLTPLGYEQVRTLAGKLKNNYGQIKQIYSSPLQRAVETAELLAGELQVSYQVEPALVEFSVGVLEGRSDQESWQLFAGLWQNWFKHKNFAARLPEGESLTEIVERVKGVIDRLQEAGQTSETYVLIGHGGTYRSALPFLVPNVEMDYLRTCKYHNTDIIELEVRDGQLICVQIGENRIA